MTAQWRMCKETVTQGPPRVLRRVASPPALPSAPPATGGSGGAVSSPEAVRADWTTSWRDVNRESYRPGSEKTSAPCPVTEACRDPGDPERLRTAADALDRMTSTIAPKRTRNL